MDLSDRASRISFTKIGDYISDRQLQLSEHDAILTCYNNSARNKCEYPTSPQSYRGRGLCVVLSTLHSTSHHMPRMTHERAFHHALKKMGSYKNGFGFLLCGQKCPVALRPKTATF